MPNPHPALIRATLVPDLASRRLTAACRRRHLKWEAIVIDRWAIFDGQAERGGRHYFVVGRAWTRCAAFDLAQSFINATTKEQQ